MRARVLQRYARALRTGTAWEAAERQAALILQAARQSSVPVDLRSVLVVARKRTRLRIAVRRGSTTTPLLVREERRLVIEWPGANVSSQRLRFTVFHELAHVLVAHALGCTVEDLATLGRGSMGQLETLCNRLASALILPAPVVDKAFTDGKYSDSAARTLASAAECSLEAVLRRYVERNRNTALLLFRLVPQTKTRWTYVGGHSAAGEYPVLGWGKLLADLDLPDARPEASELPQSYRARLSWGNLGNRKAPQVYAVAQGIEARRGKNRTQAP